MLLKPHPHLLVAIISVVGFYLPMIVLAQSNNSKDLFDTDEPLEITLAGKIRDVLNDRQEKSANHPLHLLCKNDKGMVVSLPLEVKTRGHFRKLKSNCIYPPLLLEFSKSHLLKSTVFEDQQKLKLVMPCVGDEYVIREWLVYKIYNLVTTRSFKARLVKVNLLDSLTNKATAPFYGMLLESERQMAKRNKLKLLEKKLQPYQTNRQSFLDMAVFEYLIGNTDWGVQYLQNIKLITADSTSVPITVPYDFDHAGIVNTPYAKPAEELELNSIRDRRYRGYCITDMKDFDSSFALFKRLKPGIYALYNNSSFLDPKYVKSTIKFLDDFYSTIDNANAVKKDFGYPCDKSGTGNIVIKGLKDD